VSNIQVKQEEALSIKFIHQMKLGDNRRLDLYFFLPKEMGINPKNLKEDEYFHSAITGRRSYYSTELHLPLVQSRFASQKKRTIEEFRLYLNLFAYQFAVAIDTDSKELRQIEHPEEFFTALNLLCEQVAQLLKKFRRNEPSNPKWKSYFETADNYLSWFCEQRILKLLSRAPRSSDFSEMLDAAIALCRAENQHRVAKRYNSYQTKEDPNRISNKMLLLRCLIQQGVVLKEEVKTLGTGLKKMTTGFATAMVMLVVSALIIKAHGAFSGLTIALVLSLAVIYGFREIFKEDIRNAMWRVIQKGRPKWSRILRDTTSQAVIAKQLVWLDFTKPSEIPADVAEILKHRHSQNRLDAEVLHYAIHTRVTQKEFLTGYTTIQEQVNFSLAPFARYLEGGKARIYKEQDGKISNDSVERRYQVNLILVLKEGKDEAKYARYKITMNRSNIIDMSRSKLPGDIAAIDD